MTTTHHPNPPPTTHPTPHPPGFQFSNSIAPPLTCPPPPPPPPPPKSWIRPCSTEHAHRTVIRTSRALRGKQTSHSADDTRITRNAPLYILCDTCNTQKTAWQTNQSLQHDTFTYNYRFEENRWNWLLKIPAKLSTCNMRKRRGRWRN